MTAIAQVLQKPSSLLAEGLTVLGGSLFIALMAQCSLPIGAVPITLQTFAVLLMGGLLGSKKGALAVIAYLCEGTLGLPFFFSGNGGLLHLMGPTGGYLLGFVLAAFVVGALIERGGRDRYILSLFAMAIGAAIIILFGSLWLTHFVGQKGALSLGVYPFLFGDVIKVVAAATLLPLGHKFLNQSQA